MLDTITSKPYDDTDCLLMRKYQQRCSAGCACGRNYHLEGVERGSLMIKWGNGTDWKTTQEPSTSTGYEKIAPQWRMSPARRHNLKPKQKGRRINPPTFTLKKLIVSVLRGSDHFKVTISCCQKASPPFI